jgi:hypothetical protein
MFGWLMVPGIAFMLIGIAGTMLAAFWKPMRSHINAAIRLRYVGIGLVFGLPGAQLVLSGILDGMEWGRILGGGFMVMMSALYFYAMGGITARFPQT